ncbi:MAG: VCBS repeat-containing protein [Planctomycetes bacterium]|nr:VCBS repeat-containing protein [Planctomycetota bacterium]
MPRTERSDLKSHHLLMLLASAWAIPNAIASPGTVPVREKAEENIRTIVRVAPRDIGRRPGDEMPAEFRLTAADLPGNRRLDPASLQVVRWDAGASRPLSKPLPLRWYDDAIPYDFPECEQNVHATDGLKLSFVKRPRWGDYYNLLGDGAGGRLVWTHKQEGNKPAFYSISFRLLPKGREPERLAPSGFVGDGSHRRAPLGHSTTGMIHSRVTAADWDGDGLVDFLVGGSRGHILLYRNRGTRSEPRFGPPRMLMTADGRPLDVGWSAAPCAVDWDGDGVTDLLCGAERNRVLYFRNEGTSSRPRLVNKGFVRVGDKPLELPVAPVPKSPQGVYTLDYYPVLEAVDWSGDGRIDLLAGGYITGRVYFYESVGKNADGTPKLAFRGPLQADDRPLNVGDWAAPCAADFDDDGDLDLICGNLPLNAGGGDDQDANHFLRYYENVGSRRQPRLRERPFPRKGNFPSSGLATPRAVDLNGDGLRDLVVSAGENIYIFFNVGTRTRPLFAVHDRPLPGEWGSMSLPTFGVQMIDWDRDGRLDLLSGRSIYLRKGPDVFESISLLAPGNRIEHPPPRGDGWTFTQLADLDGDGKVDLLYGTHEGNIWLHRNLGGAPPRFDEAGTLLRTADGKPLHVGPTPGLKLDFDVLQGARTTFSVADFDGDGWLDLVVGDTYGKVRIYRNTGSRKAPQFTLPREIGDMKIRMTPFAADWDGDGKPDVVGSSADGKVWWWRNLGRGRFDSDRPIKMPDVCYGPFAAVVDWNGDGDLDLLVGTAYGYSCWFERSFLEHGYAVATRVPEAGKRIIRE